MLRHADLDDMAEAVRHMAQHASGRDLRFGMLVLDAIDAIRRGRTAYFALRF